MLEAVTRVTSAVTSRLPVKKSKKAGKYLVGLDIGTENVKALIGKLNDDGTIDIIGVGRAHQALTDMQAGAIADIAGVTANCNRALAEAERQAGIGASAAVIGIAGELVKGTTITIRVNRGDPQKALDVEEVDQIIQAVQKRAFERAKEQIADELGGKEVDIRLVNSALVHMDIDGYAITNPVGFQGRTVTVQLFTAFAPMIHIGALERVATELNLDLLAVAAEPFAVARSVVGDDTTATTTAILMDVGGGTTDIAVLHEGGVQGTKMFGIGGRAFTRSVEKTLGVNFAQAEALKIALSQNKVPPQKAPAIEEALQKTVRVWRSGVELALDEFSVPDHLPHSLLLCGGGASLELLVEELERSDWYKNLPFAKKPTVKHIQPSSVIGIKDTTMSLSDHTFITAMGLLRVGVDTLSQNEDIADESGMKDRINKVLRT